MTETDGKLPIRIHMNVFASCHTTNTSVPKNNSCKLHENPTEMQQMNRICLVLLFLLRMQYNNCIVFQRQISFWTHFAGSKKKTPIDWNLNKYKTAIERQTDRMKRSEAREWVRKWQAGGWEKNRNSSRMNSLFISLNGFAFTVLNGFWMWFICFG